MEGYSLDKWRNASKEDLPPDQKADLEKYNALVEESSKRLKALDESLERGDISSAQRTATSLLELFRQIPSTIKYFGGSGYQEHEKLKEAYEETKEGQRMLAHQEATHHNELYDKLIDDAEDKRKEYELALNKLKAFSAENLEKDEASVLADLDKQKGRPRKTPRDDGPSLKDQLKDMIP